MIRSVRLRLILLYVLTVAILLGSFIVVDMVGLRRNLRQQEEAHALSPDALESTWRHALVEHVGLGLGLVAVVFVFGTVFIRRAFRPVREITETARAISDVDLSSRVDGGGDTGEIGALAETLNAMIARLETAFERERRFASDAAHELSTPLTVLRGEVEIALRRERSPEEHREILRHLQGQIDRLGGIIDDLLFLARVDAKRLEGSNTEVALEPVLEACIGRLEALAGHRDVSLHLAAEAPVVLRGDEALLGRMVDNLVDNAIKFSPDGGAVTLSLDVVGHDFRLMIRNQGIGIPPDELTRVFDRFHRIERDRPAHAKGAGLGLAIVKEIADIHGLRVTLDSDPVEGTIAAISSRGDSGE